MAGPAVNVPAECEQLALLPEQPDAHVMPALPAAADPTYLTARMQRAELAAIDLAAQRDSERTVRVANATVQDRCAAWATRTRAEQEAWVLSHVEGGR